MTYFSSKGNFITIVLRNLEQSNYRRLVLWHLANLDHWQGTSKKHIGIGKAKLFHSILLSASTTKLWSLRVTEYASS